MQKILRGVCIALGVALFATSYYLYNNFTNMPKTTFVQDNNYHVENNDESHDSGNLVLVKGKLNVARPAEDPLTGVKAEYPLLQRKVEMYQYFLKDNKVMAGWKDTPIKAFTSSKGNKYSNPAFPKNLKSQYFFGKSVLGTGNLAIDPQFLLQDLDEKKYAGSFGYLAVLPKDKVPQGFIYKKNQYVRETKQKDKVGSIRISYKVLNAKNLPELTIVGQQYKQMLHRCKEDSRFYDVPVTRETIKKTYSQDAPHAAAGAALFGAFFVLLGVFKSRA